MSNFQNFQKRSFLIIFDWKLYLEKISPGETIIHISFSLNNNIHWLKWDSIKFQSLFESAHFTFKLRDSNYFKLQTRGCALILSKQIICIAWNLMLGIVKLFYHVGIFSLVYCTFKQFHCAIGRDRPSSFTNKTNGIDRQ